MIKKIFLRSLVVMLCVWSIPLQASTSGKIAGTITDDQTGTPLGGVNVYLEDTRIGSATDLDGFFVMLNVPPGTYNLKVNYVGYAEHTVHDVVVKIDLTTRVDIALKSQIIEGETVVVEADRPAVVQDISNSQMNIEAETIANLPVQTVDQALTLQAGIEMGTQGIIVRGGGADETVFMVDGLSLNDERSNIPYTAVSLNSIKEITIQTGGFNAEYGDARSGLVNVVTREGSKNRYNASVSYMTNKLPGINLIRQKHFGPSLYDPNSYFNRPYMDPEVCWTGTANGNWDDYTRSQYPSFEGWNAISEETMQDEDPSNDLTPLGAKRLFEWQRRRKGDIEKSDYVLDIGFGGPLFPSMISSLNEDLGNARFYLSHYNERNMFVFPLATDSYQEHHTQLKVTSDLSPSMKLVMTGLYGEVTSVSPYDWNPTPTGHVLQGVSEVAGYAHASSLYMPGYYSPTEIYRTMIGAKFTHAINSRTFYDVKLQYKINKYNTYQMATRDTTKKYEPVPGYLVDEAPYGYWGFSDQSIDGTIMGGWMNLGRDKSVNSTTTFELNFSSQLNKRNQVKSGVRVIYNDFDIKSYSESPSKDTWNRSLIYHVFPTRIGAYIQDKLEYEGFIANLGVRFDYSNPNADSYDLQKFDDFFKEGYGNTVENQAPAEDAKTHFNISPRLGVSHPITENSKLYFNYGHFYAEPPSSYRFRLQRENSGFIMYMGNPNLDMEKTVAYELGYEHNVLDIFLFKIAAYYKDITNQIGSVYYTNFNNSVNYGYPENNNYADIRGAEITLSKRVGRWVSGFINYTYDVRTSGYFGLLHYYEDPTIQRNYNRINPKQTRVHPRPYARASLDFHTPDDFGKTFGDFNFFNNWNLNILADWRSGSYATYDPFETGVVDNIQWRDWHNVDMRLSKMLQLKNLGLKFFVDISNVFNVKYMNYAGFSNYNYDFIPYLESLNFSWEKGVEHGDDRVGDYRPANVAYDPLEPNPYNDSEIAARNKKRKEDKSYIDNPDIEALTFLNPRKITLGINIHF